MINWTYFVPDLRISENSVVGIVSKDIFPLSLAHFNLCTIWKSMYVYVRQWITLTVGSRVDPTVSLTVITLPVQRYMKANTELFTQTSQTVFTIFCFQKMFKITKLVPQCLMLPIERYW